MTTALTLYSDQLEIPLDDEERIFDDIATARPVHAKSHGLLKADLQVLANLPDHLRQGLFATPASYPAIMRFSTNPGDMLPEHFYPSRIGRESSRRNG